ncbi:MULTISPECIES: C40 family peptidase [unclassified Hydrogenobaculum]|uniref:C40 family peptidase n=1 Tax=unclassified Hydrogenobaculum TaxID=2622382 RepID=UPI0001C527E5|nr:MULTISPECIES: C40 family peptidase [unclassified Hydrogenobaculum]AEF19336.1 NLP/P60 protein [Hydrogenobaculum sp. 3684]AEG46625.1 NLP/P60 protein [Hydrogenobaculum sp. SHO]AGG15269.1 NLP/P60 protein [Hydrogenobaculum sp. HO]AGH93571.1 cell wall-associated hydrolase, invasion-associated protein [Hydrogenobaculum sp. SN]
MKKVLFAFGILAFGVSISLGDPIKRIINEYSNATYRVRNDDIIGDYIRQNIDYANRGFRPASYTYKTYGKSYSYKDINRNFIERLKEVAFQYLGIPYRFGGNSRYGIDCSAFTQDVFRQLGINLPRTAREQARLGKLVRHHLKPGDLLFFSTYAPYPSHVGIYIGNGKMIEASSVYGRVIVDDVANDPYLTRHFLFAKRILP